MKKSICKFIKKITLSLILIFPDEILTSSNHNLDTNDTEKTHRVPLILHFKHQENPLKISLDDIFKVLWENSQYLPLSLDFYEFNDFPDHLLFNLTHDAFPLELNCYFLKKIAEREDKKVNSLVAQFQLETEDHGRQNRLINILNTTLIKREILASSVVVLNRFLYPEQERYDVFLDLYIALGDLFHEYRSTTSDSHNAIEETPRFHRALCDLTANLGFKIPDLLTRDLLLHRLEKEQHAAHTQLNIDMSPLSDSSSLLYQKYLNLINTAQDLGEQATRENALSLANKAALVEHAAFISQKAQMASDQGDFNKANQLIDYLEKIKEELLTL